MSNFLGSALPPTAFGSGMALLALKMLFHLTRTLLLGTLFNDRGPVIGIQIGVLFGAMFLMPYLGDAVLFMPWLIIPSGGHIGLAPEVMMGQSLSTATPILATIVWNPRLCQCRPLALPKGRILTKRSIVCSLATIVISRGFDFLSIPH